MNDKSFPWNYRVVFHLPQQVYYTTYTLKPNDTTAEVEAKLEIMDEYSDALAVINKIKAL